MVNALLGGERINQDKRNGIFNRISLFIIANKIPFVNIKF
jgi:hypothetical protein